MQFILHKLHELNQSKLLPDEYMPLAIRICDDGSGCIVDYQGFVRWEFESISDLNKQLLVITSFGGLDETA